jgi:two-component system, OmpR family, alkaline phosphatase synthesis response regulator PhoP
VTSTLSAMDKLLIIEDDLTIHKALAKLFGDEGYTVEFATDGLSGLAAFRAAPPALVILDLKLPQMPGREVCREIRKLAPSIPIVVLSAITEEVDKVLLLELGADDYVTKPFSPREFLARVRATIRRAQRPATLDQFSFDEIFIDFAKMELKRSGQIVEMTRQEFKVLKYFAQNPERVISRNQVLSEVWGYESYPTTRTVDNHILNLRQKLELDPGHPTHFLTVHGVGYKFVP